ncbi:aminotransferase class IV, partial [Candidatus Sumerlaeota bacterium]|nr:aminotransferase class IV [Candidatus Sumerlaeota bacterium]
YGVNGFVVPDPSPTKFILVIYESALPEPTGFSAILSSFRRPSPESAPTLAKASCLYPNVARSIAEANAQGSDTGVILDPAGNVAEFSLANLFYARGGVIYTPEPNPCFLNGITRQRIIQLLREDGFQIVERTIPPEELATAEEAFGTGNYAKIAPCTRLLGRELAIGPIFKRAYRLYLDFAKTQVRDRVMESAP